MADDTPEPGEPRYPGGPQTPEEVARSKANWAAAMARLGIAMGGGGGAGASAVPNLAAVAAKALSAVSPAPAKSLSPVPFTPHPTPASPAPPPALPFTSGVAVPPLPPVPVAPPAPAPPPNPPGWIPPYLRMPAFQSLHKIPSLLRLPKPPKPTRPSGPPPNPQARALAAIGAALGTGTLRQLNTNPALGMMLGAGFLQSRNARLGLTALAAGRLATRHGRNRVRKGARIAARSLGYSKKAADRFGKVAAAGGAVGGVAVAAVAFVKAVVGMTEESVRFAARLAEVSGSMAAVMAERNVREVLRGQRQGERVAGTTRELSRSEQNFKDAVEPIESLIVNIKNTILSAILGTLADLLAPVTYLAEAANRYFGKEPKEDDGIDGALRAIAAAAERARAAGRPEFARPVAAHRP